MLKQPVLAEDDPRRANYTETTYQGSRGGWVQPSPEPERETQPRPSS